MQTKPSIVFVHGIWADGSCFTRVGEAYGATIYEIDSSRVSMLSQPGFAIDVIRSASKAVQEATTSAKAKGA